jgi:MFS family permease
MSLAAFAVYAVIVNQVPLLIGRGLSIGTAALALGLGGLGQVCGRLFYRQLAAATSIRTRTFLVLAAGGVLTALLGLLPGPAWLLIAMSVLVGAARGLFTLLQATAISDRWGETHYGTLNGILSAPVLLATALAPWAGAALAGWLGGYPAVFAVLAAISVAAAVLALATRPERSNYS